MKAPRTVLFLALAGVSVAAPFAAAEVVNPAKPTTVVVGAAPGPMTMSRIDPQRRGVTTFALPRGPLRALFRKPLSTAFDQPVLVAPNGDVIAVSSRGDVYTLASDGEEKSRVIRGGIGVSPSALLSDGTVVFVTARGEAVGVRNGAATFETRLVNGATTTPRAAPLPLVDGGFVVAAASDLVLLDSRGKIRARTSLPEAAMLPLVLGANEVFAVGSSGAVFAWPLGGESRRIGAFSSSVSGSVARTPSGALVGVLTNGSHIATIDPISGITTAYAVPDRGLFAGHAAVLGDRIFALHATPNALFGVSYGALGEERSRTRLATLSPPDGGPPPGAQVGPLVDSEGSWGFATVEGMVGVATGTGVDTLGEKVCSMELRGAVAGLSPSTAGSFIVTCRNGTIVKIGGRPNAEP